MRQNLYFSLSYLSVLFFLFPLRSTGPERYASLYSLYESYVHNERPFLLLFLFHTIKKDLVCILLIQKLNKKKKMCRETIYKNSSGTPRKKKIPQSGWYRKTTAKESKHKHIRERIFVFICFLLFSMYIERETMSNVIHTTHSSALSGTGRNSVQLNYVELSRLV